MKKKILAVLLATGVAATTLLGGSILVSAADDGGNTAQARTLDEIKEDGKIKIGVFSDKNPFGYVDENGDVQGYDIYFGKRLAKDLLGSEDDAEFTYVEAASRVEYLQSAKVDVILANFTVTDDRAEKVDFALPYMKVALGVVSPDDALIKDVKDLEGKKLIVVKGTTAETYFTDNYPDIELVKFDEYQEAYDAGSHNQNCKNHYDNDQSRAGLLIRLGLGWLRLLVGRRSRLWLCRRWFYRCCCLWLWCRSWLYWRYCLWLRCWCRLNRRCCLWLRCLSWLYWRWCWFGRFYCWLYRRWLCYRCTALSTESCTRFNGRTTFYTYLILLRLWLYGLLWSCRLHFSQLFCKITSAFGTKLGIILNFTLTLWTLHLILSSSFYSNICVPYPISLHVFYAK